MFKEGNFYAIQGKGQDGKWYYLDVIRSPSSHSEKLAAISRRIKMNNSYGSYRNDYDSDETIDNSSNIKRSINPFDLKVFEVTDKWPKIIETMRYIRQWCGGADVDPSTIRVVEVSTTSKVFVPAPESDQANELRKFALEKLSSEEKELLKVTHWDVYHKLGDRSILNDDEDE